MYGPRLSVWHDVHCALTDSCRSITGVSAPCGLWQSEHFILFSMIGWCDGFMIAVRICMWQVPQRSASLGRNEVVYGATGTVPLGRACMLWQLVHATSFLECLPDSQNTR